MPLSRDEHCIIINLEEKINKAIELRLEKFVKEIQQIKTKQKKLEARHKAKHKKGTITSIEKMKKFTEKDKNGTKSKKKKK